MDIKVNKKTFLAGVFAVIIAIAGGAAGFYFSGGYELENSADTLKITSVQSPAPTNYNSADKPLPNPLLLNFNQPAAEADKIGVNFNTGISIQPDIRGSWQWQNRQKLVFTPETDWLPDTSYKVNFSKNIFRAAPKPQDLTFKFNTPVFSGRLSAAEFYENPQELQSKSVTASFIFSYPINTTDLKDHIKIRTVSGDSYDFDYKLTDNNTALHIISKPVKIKSEVDFAKISVTNLGNAYNQKTLDKNLETTVKIPSSSTFFQIKKLFSHIVRNAQNNNNPEQILSVEFTTAVNNRQLQNALTLNYIAEDCYNVSKKLATTQGKEELAPQFKQLAISEVSVQTENAKKHLFKYDEPQNSGCLVAVFDNSLTSVEGFKLGQSGTVSAISTSLTPYPLEADIAFDGSIMSLQGSRKVAFISRGAKELVADIARIKESDLNHLVTQTYGNFTTPDFINYNFSEDNISEIFHKKLPINTSNPAEANYSSLDFNEYFQNRKGVFLLTLYGQNGDRRSPASKRLLLLTDLGIVVKDNADNTHNIFVSNIASETPVTGAKVQVLGKNGLPIFETETNEQGMAQIADFSEFKNDKYAVAYKVSLGKDISFLPINWEDRKLNLSRFDIGGDYIDNGNTIQTSLKGYIFSDRGIYRPGESGHLGILVRQADLHTPQQLPFELTIRKPNGETLAVKKLKSNEFGFMEYEFSLPVTTQTGTYSADLWLQDKENNQRFVAYSSFRVEEFTPDTLKIKAQWQPEAPKGWINESSLKAAVNLQNLYGNPAAGHTLQAEYSLTPVIFYFAEFKDYKFLNPLQEQKVRSYKDSLPEVQTDKDGNAELFLNLDNFEKGTYRLQLNIDGLEAGSARGVGTGLNVLVSPEEYLIGWKADGALNYINKDAERSISFIAVNNDLQPLEPDNLTLQLIKKDYVSSLVEQKNGTFQYQMVAKETILNSRKFTVSAGGQNEKLPTSEPGEYILKVLNAKNQLLAKIEFNIAGAADLLQKTDKNANLSVKLNKNEYASDENIEMQIAAPYSGYGLITIERDKVYAYKWFKTETAAFNQSITLPAGIEGNAYLNIAMFRSLQSDEIYTSPLSYSAVPFNINKENRRLNITLDVPQTVKPGKDLLIRYQTSEPAQIAVYGVNEGILQIAGYKMPKLLDIFLAKRALRVVTEQIMDLIMPDIRFLKNLSSSGGDGAEEETALNRNLNPFARKTDKPAAFWSGIMPSDEKGDSYTYKVPETFSGSLKIMAVAVSADRFGSTEKNVLARGDFALVPSGPYNITPNDEFVIGLSVGNLIENSGSDYQVKISAAVTDGLEISSDSSQTSAVAENGEIMLKFKFKAKEKLGSQQITFTAQSLNDSSKTAVMPYTLSIRPAVPYSSQFNFGLAKSSYTADNIEDLYDEYRVQQLSASTSPLVLAQGLLKYLNKYPHYCTEQTISKVFPAIELFFKSPDLVKGLDIYALFDDAIRILRERQVLGGGFTAWSNLALDVNNKDTLYATHFLVTAKQHGFNVPNGLLDAALGYCETVAAGKPADKNDYTPAYAAYILTLDGKITTNYLLNLEEFYKTNYTKDWHSSLSAEFLAAGYKMLQDEKRADSLAGRYQNGTDSTENAINIYLLAKHFPNKLKILDKESLESLLKPLSTGNFTTYSAGWSVLALNAFNSQTTDNEIKFSRFSPVYTPFPTVSYLPQTKNLSVSAPQPFYYANAQQGFAKSTQIKAAAKGLSVSKSITDKNGQPVTKAKLGDVLTVKVIYSSLGKEPVSDVAITDLLAGCFEVVEDSLKTENGVDSVELREDRINVYATAFVYEQSFSYQVKVVAEGTYALPPVYADAMYQPLLRANSDLRKITIGE